MYKDRVAIWHLIVLLNEVEAAVARHESCDLLAVLDQLHTHALANGRVRLLRFDTHLRRPK